jgi:hypothetical protein
VIRGEFSKSVESVAFLVFPSVLNSSIKKRHGFHGFHGCKKAGRHLFNKLSSGKAYSLPENSAMEIDDAQPNTEG